MPIRTFKDLLGIPPPEKPSPRWHVAPPVDTAAYAFSWLPVLLALELLETQLRPQRIYLVLLVVGLTFVHRHYTLFYVYLDREVYARSPRRFTAVPAVLLGAFSATPLLWNTPAQMVIAGIIYFAGAWNVRHFIHAECRTTRSWAGF